MILQDYWPFSSRDIPEELNLEFYDGKRNPVAFLGAKATGEPCFLLGVSVLFAIRDAINAARRDLRNEKSWYSLGECQGIQISRNCIRTT